MVMSKSVQRRISQQKKGVPAPEPVVVYPVDDTVAQRALSELGYTLASTMNEKAKREGRKPGVRSWIDSRLEEKKVSILSNVLVEQFMEKSRTKGSIVSSTPIARYRSPIPEAALKVALVINDIARIPSTPYQVASYVIRVYQQYPNTKETFILLMYMDALELNVAAWENAEFFADLIKLEVPPDDPKIPKRR